MRTDEEFMRMALEQAQQAADIAEVPVGAVLVQNGEVIATGYNQVIAKSDSTCHAEVDAIRQAGKALDNYRLVNTTLYVTLEPCSMCVGAIIHSRISRLVFGAFDQKTGAVTSATKLIDADIHNHKVEWQGGVLEEECASILQNFFKERRKQAKKSS